MSKKIPSWVKNVLMFGGMPAIALLISNNVAAQNQTTTTRTDSVVITQSKSSSGISSTSNPSSIAFGGRSSFFRALCILSFTNSLI